MPKAAARKSEPKGVQPYPKSSPRQTSLTESSGNKLSKADSSSNSSKPMSNTTSNASSSSDASGSFLDVELEGDEEDEVPVYDKCSDVRAKITRFLSSNTPVPGEFKKDGTPKPYMKTQFCKDIGHVNGNSLKRFMSSKGETGGAENGTYYGAYCFFERLRIHNKKPKSASRKRAEGEFPNGRPLEDRTRRNVWVFTGPPRH